VGATAFRGVSNRDHPHAPPHYKCDRARKLKGDRDWEVGANLSTNNKRKINTRNPSKTKILAVMLR